MSISIHSPRTTVLNSESPQVDTPKTSKTVSKKPPAKFVEFSRKNFKIHTKVYETKDRLVLKRTVVWVEGGKTRSRSELQTFNVDK
jgi:hypothetical protein